MSPGTHNPDYDPSRLAQKSKSNTIIMPLDEAAPIQKCVIQSNSDFWSNMANRQKIYRQR